MNMNNTNIVAIISILATAIASIYSTYTQYEISRFQQIKITELEKYKHEKQIDVIKINSEIKRLNEHCSKIETAIKEIAELEALSLTRDDTDTQISSRAGSYKYLYLLSRESIDKLSENMDKNKNYISIIKTLLQSEYNTCLGKLNA